MSSIGLTIHHWYIVTTRKRSLGQGYIFRSVCQEFCSQGGVLPQCMLGYPPLGPGTPQEQISQDQAPPEADPPGTVHAGRYGLQVGGILYFHLVLSLFSLFSRFGIFPVTQTVKVAYTKVCSLCVHADNRFTVHGHSTCSRGKSGKSHLYGLSQYDSLSGLLLRTITLVHKIRAMTEVFIRDRPTLVLSFLYP